MNISTATPTGQLPVEISTTYSTGQSAVAMSTVESNQSPVVMTTFIMTTTGPKSYSLPITMAKPKQTPDTEIVFTTPAARPATTAGQSPVTMIATFLPSQSAVKLSTSEALINTNLGQSAVVITTPTGGGEFPVALNQSLPLASLGLMSTTIILPGIEKVASLILPRDGAPEDPSFEEARFDHPAPGRRRRRRR